MGDDGFPDPGSSGGYDPSTGAEPIDPSESIASGENFIDAFFLADGLALVHAGGVTVMSREGEVLRSHESDRAITSAAFDGDRIVLADQAELTVLDTALAPSVSSQLVEGCASSVLLGGGRFVCGPENDWDRIFYTYDVADGSLLGQSDPYTYNGVPMRRVPGRDEFVSITHDSSPSDFHLYALSDDARAIYINESPYHGDFAVQIQYAFWGDPATHAITTEGLLLRIHREGCEPDIYPGNCFVKDGELGTLPVDVFAYVELREGDANTIYALAQDTPDGSYARPDVLADGLAVIAADSAPFLYGGDAGAGFDVHYMAL